MPQIQIRETTGAAVAKITIAVSERQDPAEAHQLLLMTDRAGNQSWPIWKWPVQDYTLHINVFDHEARYEAISIPLTAPASGAWGDIEITLPFAGRAQDPIVQPGATPGQGLTTAGQHGRLEAPAGSPIFRVGGQPWRWLACDGFAALLLEASGESVDPFLDWVIATEFVKIRVFMGLYWIAQQMGRPGFLATPEQLDRFLQKTTARQLRVELTCGDMNISADGRQVGVCPELADQRRQFAAWAEVIQQYELVTAETVNEGFKNGVEATAIGRLGGGIIQTSGNYAPPCEPRLNYGVTHTGRDDEWPRKGKELYDLFSGFDPDMPGGARFPWVSDEPMGADEQKKNGSRSNVPEDFFDDAAVCALMGAGGTAHGTDLVYARIPGPRQQACHRAYVAGSHAIPLEAPLGSYTRGLLSDCPLEHDDSLALRTFARISGNTATAVVVRPTSDERVARNGWRIVARRGPNDRVIDLER